MAGLQMGTRFTPTAGSRISTGARPATTRVGMGTAKTGGTVHAIPVAGSHGTHPPAGAGHTTPKPATVKSATTRATQVRNAPAQSTNWLEPMTAKQVTNTASSLVKTAYQPAYNEFNTETQTENGILSKQESDNQFYQNWLDQKSAALQANQTVVDNATNALTQQLTGAQQQMLGAQDQNLTAAANERPGNVTPNGPAFNPGSAMGNYLQSGQVAANTELTGAATQAAAVEQTNSNALGEAIANTGAVVSAGQAKEVAAYNTALDKIISGEATLSSKEASSMVSEIAKLQGEQISISENNRNYNTAVAKLGISEANTSSEIASRSATTKLNQQKFALTQQQDQFNDWAKNQTLAQNEQKIGISLANTNSEIAYRNAETAAKLNGGYLTVNESNTIFNEVKKAQGTINGLIQQGMKPNVAYAAVLNGYYVTTKTLSSGKTERVRVSVPRMNNQTLLNAAYHTSSAGGGKLTQNDVKALTTGMKIPQQYISNNFQVESVAQTQAGNAASSAGGAVTNALSTVGLS